MKLTFRGALAASALAVAPVALAGPTGNVLSRDIRDADNATAQDTTRGSGVKTGHIQNGAVTATKLADGAVTTAKVVDGAITAAKIATGAVTDAKISGIISAAKLPATLNADTVDGMHAAAFAPAAHAHPIDGVVGLDEALAGKAGADHTHDGLYQGKYANVIVVAKSGGDFTDPVAALNSIVDASATNRYLVKIMPGVYDVAPVTLFMKDFVEVEGSGRGVTELRCQSWHMGHAIAAVYFFGVTSEIRDLSIRHAGGLPTGQTCGVSGSYVFGVNADYGASARVTNVDIVVSNGSWTAGVVVGNGSAARAILQDVSVTATGLQPACVSEQTYGVEVGGYGTSGAEAVLRNVQLDVSASHHQGSFYVHTGATAKGFGVQASLPPLTTWGSGPIKCIACYDQNQDPLPAVLVP